MITYTKIKKKKRLLISTVLLQSWKHHLDQSFSDKKIKSLHYYLFIINYAWCLMLKVNITALIKLLGMWTWSKQKDRCEETKKKCLNLHCFKLTQKNYLMMKQSVKKCDRMEFLSQRKDFWSLFRYIKETWTALIFGDKMIWKAAKHTSSHWIVFFKDNYKVEVCITKTCSLWWIRVSRC